MEAAAARWVTVPYDFQQDNWSMEPAAIWAPGFPVEYASTEMFGSCIQTSVPSSTVGQIVEYAEATHHDPIGKAAKEFEVDVNNMEMKISNPISVFEETAHEFNVDINMVEKKIHRYPTMVRALGDWYTIPTMVAIGPYHHYRSQLMTAEKLKHVAAYQCIRESGHSLQEMYGAVVAAAYDCRSLYDKGVMSGITDDDYLPIMFYDACFLVQYMIWCTDDDGSAEMDPSLGRYLRANDEEIFHDIMLLENQIPWRVVQAVMRFRPVPLKTFVASLKGCLLNRIVPEEKPFELDDIYEPPHLLGLLRYYIVGRRSSGDLKPLKPTEAISFSVSAIELSEIGIKLTAKNSTELIHMGIKKEGSLFAELALAPLSLDESSASFLVNMAAFELCTTLDFQGSKDEDSAVCSYLELFSMFVDREEDVHELRTKHLLQGGGGLPNTKVLRFFTSLQGLCLGSCYVRIMEEIEDYKAKRQVRIKVHAFVYKNKKTIAVVISAIVSLVSIVGTIASLKGK